MPAGDTKGLDLFETVRFDGTSIFQYETLTSFLMETEQTIFVDSTDEHESIRTLLETLHTQCICCIACSTRISLDRTPEKLANHLFENGYAKTFNKRYCEEIAGMTPESVQNSSIRNYLSPDFKNLLSAFFENDCQLYEEIYEINRDASSSRRYEVSLVGDIYEAELISVWISFKDVTPRRRVEEGLVTTLEQQRRKLARELHDSIGQLLTSIRILSDDLAEKLPPELEKEKRLAKHIYEFALEASDEAARLEDGLLTPKELSEEGLVEALGKIARTTDRLPHISCTFSTDFAGRFDEKTTALQLYRITQEAVNNAIRHADPDQIDISLVETTDRLILEVSDDGCGFDPNTEHLNGLGLESMQYRAELIDCDLQITSASGQGTTIRCVQQKRRK
jgi:signal transduction histidine kinase